MASFSVSCSFLFPNFVFGNGENSVAKSPRVLASTVMSYFNERNTKQITMKKVIGIGSLILILLLTFFALKPNNVSEKSCQKVSGVVTHINEAGVNDATFKLAGNETSFYINRALENKFTLNQLQNEILNKEVTIYFVKNSSFLNPKESQQIRKMEIGKEAFYTEF